MNRPSPTPPRASDVLTPTRRPGVGRRPRLRPRLAAPAALVLTLALAAPAVPAAAQADAPAAAQADAPPLDSGQFVDGLVEIGLDGLIEELAADPPADPAQAADLRAALVERYLPSLAGDPSRFLEGLRLIHRLQEAMYEQAPRDHWARPTWGADYAEQLLLQALPTLYQAGEFALLGFPSQFQQEAVDFAAEHALEMTNRAEEEFARIQVALRGRDDFTDAYVNTGRWDELLDYQSRNIPYFRTWAILYLNTQADDGPYFSRFDDPAAQRARLLKQAASEIGPVIEGAVAEVLTDESLARMRIAAAQLELARDDPDAALRQLDQAAQLEQASRFMRFILRLTRAKALHQAGRIDEMDRVLTEAKGMAIARENPLNLVLIADRRFLVDYRRAQAADDPMERRRILQGAFDVYAALLRNPALGEWQGAIQQFVERRYERQVPPDAPAETLPPPVRLAQVRKAFNAGEQLRQNGQAEAAAERYQAAIDRATALLEAEPIAPVTEAETMFFLGVAQLRGGQAPQALRTFIALADAFADQARGEQAIRIAVASLAVPIYRSNPDNAAAQRLLEEAMHVLFTRYPNIPLAAESTYTYAAYLRERERYADAVEAYNRVPADHAAYVAALYEKASCLGALWQDAPPTRRAERAQETRRALERFLEVAEQALPERSGESRQTLRRYMASAMVLEATILNETANAPDRAAEIVAEVRRRFDDVEAVRANLTSLEIRIAQKRGAFSRAEQLLRQYMQQSPQRAGPLALAVLQSLIDEVEQLADRDAPPDQLRERARIARGLAENLVVPWVRQQERFNASQRLSFELLPANALMAAGQHAQALEQFDALIAEYGRAAEQNFDVVRGRAEALFQVGRAEPDRRAELFAEAQQELRKIIRFSQQHQRFGDDHWWAQMRWMQMMALRSEGPNPAIARHIRRLENRHPGLGGEPYRSELRRLLEEHG